MSIALQAEVDELKARVAALEAQMQRLMDIIISGPNAPLIERKRPGPPKGYKRQPKQAQPNG